MAVCCEPERDGNSFGLRNRVWNIGLNFVRNGTCVSDGSLASCYDNPER